MAESLTNNQTLAPRPRRTPGRTSEMQKGWLHQDAVAVLRRLILSGELPPGERLREVPISERLGVSRTPVREAFRTLAAEGLIELMPNRSVEVSEINIEDAADAFAVLGVLEALAAQFACDRMPEDKVQILTDLQATMENQFATADRVGYTETNRLIHELIVEGSANIALITAWRMILPRAQRARTLNNLDRRRWADALREHRDMLTAIKERDGQHLAALIREHFDHGVESIFKRQR